MHKGLRCELIRTTSELEAFQASWQTLWSEDAHATPFQRPEWLLPWWHQFGQPDLRSVVILQQGRPVAFLPFYIYREPASGERQLLLMGAGTTDYLDGIFSPDCTPEHVHHAIDLLRSEADWDVLYTSQLRPESMLFQAFNSHGAPDLWRFETESCSQMHAVSMAGLPVKIRRNAMYYRNRALRQGKLEFTVADASNWAESFDALERLHTARWQSFGEPGVLADPKVLAWHHEALPLLEAAGLLRLCCLRLNGKIIGVLYSLIDPASKPERTQYFYLTAFSIEHADLRPGTLLLGFAIEHAAQEGVKTIDMLRGNEAYKKIWRVEPVSTYGFALPSASQDGEPACVVEMSA